MNLALFDFDGTITTKEMLPAFVYFAVSPVRLRLGRLQLAPWIAGYRLGWVSGISVREKIARVGFRGMRQAEYLAAGERFAGEALPPVLRPEAMARIAWHKDRGDRVVVVSGGFDVYLSHWCRAHGLELICSKLAVANGMLTGRYEGAQCVREEKPRRVREQYALEAYEAVYAYGDTPEDFALLEIADHRWYRGKPVTDA
jgi:phosphatidylglycerophosphatase C